MRLFKVVISLFVVGGLATAVYASAARLNLNSQGVQAGNAVIRGCQGDAALDISYGTHYVTEIGFFAVDSVTIGNIADSCISALPLCTHTIHVVLTFGPPAPGSQDLGVQCINSNPVVYTIPVTSQPNAADLTDIHVLIK
ncbi:MAG TPA: hypothetical protein VNN21_11450 [Dehalococcoidia bacterium]|jgi:hypothetical protein|nr:hypothetical protein [Dehalococcoidia bacterium]